MKNGTTSTNPVPQRSTPTGIEGLDDILRGGLTPAQLYIIEGLPGSGKTTLGLQILLAAVSRGERVLYITLSESRDELRAMAKTHGWSLDNIDILQLSADDAVKNVGEQYTMFHPSEIELGEATRAVISAVIEAKATMVVLDSLTEFRLLAGNAFRFRRQFLALKQMLIQHECTALMMDDLTGERDRALESVAHAVLLLEQLSPEYGSERRRLRVMKHRGKQFRGGYHDYNIAPGGLQVFPRLVAAESRHNAHLEPVSSGIEALDRLLGGGLDAGTSTLIMGAAGTGKSTLASAFASANADRGKNAAMFIFDEGLNTLLARCDGLSIPLRKHYEEGRITIQQVDPAELSPGQFVHEIRKSVENRDARVIVIDSLNGYLHAMPEERFLTAQLHELLGYLGQAGVATILLAAQHGLVSSSMQTPVDTSYLADTVVLMRYFELRGEVRQALSVVKKRGGAHERTIREFSLSNGAIHIGEPLRQFRGVWTGVPEVLSRESHASSGAL